MNKFSVSKAIIDMQPISDSLNGISEISGESFNGYVGNAIIMYDGKPFVVRDDMIIFSGMVDGGAMISSDILYSYPLINSSTSFVIEFDYVVDNGTVGNTSGEQVLMGYGTGNSPVMSIITSLLYKSVVVLYYTSYISVRNVTIGYYDFKVGVKYNLKIISVGDYISIYINDILLGVNNRVITSYGGSGNDYMSLVKGQYIFLGMNYKGDVNYGLKGGISNFKYVKIASDDPYIYSNTLYSMNRLLYLSLDFIKSQTSLYNNESIKDFGCGFMYNRYSNINDYANQFISLQDDYISWFKPIKKTPLFFDFSKIKLLYEFSISIRIKTSGVLSESTLVDTRTEIGVYNGFILTQPSEDPSSLRFYISNINKEYDNVGGWYELVETPSATIQPNSEYLITIMYKNGIFGIYVNDVFVSQNVDDGIIPNYVSNNIYFGSGVNADSLFNNVIRDISIYDIAIKPSDDILTKNISYEYNPPEPLQFNNIDLSLTIIPNRTPLTLYVDEGANNMKIIDVGNYYNRYTFYKEGGNGNERLILYIDGESFIDTFGILTFDFIDIQSLRRYSLSVDGVICDNFIYDLGAVRGYITYYLNTTLNACVGADYRVRLMRRMDGRVIGEYEFKDGFCTVSNLDRSVAYDAILFDKTNKYESVTMSNRIPLAVE